MSKLCENLISFQIRLETLVILEDEIFSIPVLYLSNNVLLFFNDLIKLYNFIIIILGGTMSITTHRKRSSVNRKL